MTGLLGVAMAHPFIALAVALGTIFTISQKLGQSQKELADTTRDSAQAAKAQSDSIDDYTKRYQDLHKALLDSRGDEEATKGIKEQLLELQKEINAQFGEEYGYLNLVGSGYRDLTNDIKEYKKAAARKYLNEDRKGNKQAVREMSIDSYKLSRDSLDPNNPQHQIILETAYKFEGKGIGVIGNVDIASDQLDGTYHIMLYADPKSGKNVLNDFMSELNAANQDGIFETELNLSSGAMKEINEKINTYGDAASLTLESEVIINDELSPLYDKATEAVGEYNKAVANSEDPFNDINVETAYNALKSVDTAVKESGEGWTKYKSVFSDVFDQADTRAYEFAKRIQGGEFEEGIKKAASTSLVDLEALYDSQALDDPFVTLVNSAEEYGLKLQDVIGILQMLGVVQESSFSPSGIDLSGLKEQIRSLPESRELISKAISEQNQNGTISSATISELKSKYSDLSSVLHVSAAGFRINTTELAKLNTEEKQNIQKDIPEKYKKLIETYNESSAALAAYQNRLLYDRTLTDAQRNSLESLIATKRADCDTTMEQITELKYLQAEYENVISKHNAFMNTMNSPDVGDGYDGIQSNLSQVKETWNDGGTGSDKIRAIVDYMSYNDMSTASIEEITAAYHEAIAAAELYFTEGSEGSERFLQKLKSMGYATESDTGQWEIAIEDINELAENLGYSVDFVRDNLDKLSYYGIEFDFDVNWGETNNISDLLASVNNEIKQTKENIEALKQSNPDADTSELEEKLDTLLSQRRELVFEIRAEVNIQKAIEEIHAIQQQIDELDIDTDSSRILELQENQQILADKVGITVEYALNTKTDRTLVDGLIADIDNFTSTDKEITVVANTTLAKTAIEEVTNTPYTAKITLTASRSGFTIPLANNSNISNNNSSNNQSKTNGSARWTGTAYANGSWKVGYNGKALVGELGEELLVRNGRTIPLGTNGAEFVNLHSDDIIFNHVQTKQLEQSGRINTRGQAFANGSVSAFITGSYNPLSSLPTSYYTNAPSANGMANSLNKATKSAKKVTDETKKQSKEFEWIKKALDYISLQRERISEEVEYENNTYKEQLSYLKELLAIDKEMIATNEAALANYANQWAEICQKILEAFGAEEGNSLIAKIMRGDVSADGWKDIFEYDSNDEVMQQKIELIDGANNIYSSLTDQEDKYKEAQRKYTEDLQKQYEIRINMIKAYLDEVQSDMDKAESSLKMKETTGRMITEDDYKEMIRLAEEQIDLYHDQIDTLEEKLDEQEEGTEEYYRTQSQIASCKNAISQCEQKQAEWNEEILNLPIRRIERYLELLELIKRDMTNKLDEQEALGINATKEQLQSLIDITKQQIDKLKEQHEAVVKKLPNYEFGSDKYNETKKEIQDIEDSVSDLIQSQIEYNQQLLNIPLEKISKLTDRLQNVKDALSEIADGYDAAVGTVTKTIDRQIDSINDLKDSSEESYEAMIKPLQEQLDLLSKQNAERKIQLALEQAQYDLERAKNQKTTQVKNVA